jgi:predicted permease
MLFALGGATLLVLLITCANVANLSVARAVRRSREFAVRSALGAGRRRLARQLITESLLVALAGGVLGLGLAWLSLDLLVSFVGRFTARTGEITLNGTVLFFTLGVSVLTGVIFGVAPALAARRNPSQSMRDGAAQAGESAPRQRLRAGLVAAQVAVSFVLLVAATLLLQSFHRLASVSLGFDTDHFMTATMAGSTFLVNPTKDDLAKVARDNQAILERLRSSAGVSAAAMTSAVPLTRVAPVPRPIEIQGRANTGARSFRANINVASDGYFSTLQIPLLAGREFRAADNDDAPRVTILNASMAKFWDGADPVGSRIRPAGSTNDATWLTVIGVVSDFRLYGGDQDVLAEYYIPFQQNGGFGGGRLIARAEGDPGMLVKAIKDAVHAISPDTAVKDLKTTAELRDGRLAAPRLTATLLSIFAAVALVITLAGITGVIATSVSQRTREFGLRMALGASRTSVLQLVLGRALLLVVVGLAAGVGGALAFSQTLQSFLFHTATTDVGSYLIVAGVFLAAGTAACLVPARRATTIDPLTALRTE